MSENSAAPGTPPGTAPGPQPEPIRFFGTTWVDHDGGYGLRRAGVAVGSLAAAVAACFVLRFAYEGLEIAEVGGFVGVLVIAMFSICSVIAFRKTWEGFGARPTDPSREDALRGLKSIGFIGSLLAYFVRSLTEAPGESCAAPSTRRPAPSSRSAARPAPATRRPCKTSGRKRPKRG